jgi:hypothetical protein
MDDVDVLLPPQHFPYYYFRGELVGPPIPFRDSEEILTFESKHNLQFNDFTKQTFETNFIVQFINDFPIDFKSGGFVIELKWKI